MFFGSEDEAHASSPRELPFNQWRQVRKTDDRLLRLAMGERAGADNQCAGRDGFGERIRPSSVSQQSFRADGRPGFVPMRLERRHNSKVPESEVGHGARGSADVQWIARRNQHDVDGLGFKRQKMIVVPQLRDASRSPQMDVPV